MIYFLLLSRKTQIEKNLHFVTDTIGSCKQTKRKKKNSIKVKTIIITGHSCHVRSVEYSFNIIFFLITEHYIKKSKTWY